jgi:hypothetical protein
MNRTLRAQMHYLLRRPKAFMDGLKVLRALLKRQRWDDQQGYPGYLGDGKWDFISSGLGQAAPEELNALFALAGIEPDVIESKGDCTTCGNSVVGSDGRRYEQGYSGPCGPCKRPKMSNWVPIKKLKKSA